MSLILSLIFLWIAGAFFVLVMIDRRGYDYSIPEFLSLSFFLGAGLITYQLFVYYLVGAKYDLGSFVAVPGVMLLIMLAFCSARPEKLGGFSTSIKNIIKWNRVEKLLAAGILVQFLWTVFLVLPMPVHSHDAMANYALKAKIFYTIGGIPAGFFTWGEATIAHPDYPPLLPFLMTWIHTFTGFNDFAVNMIMPIFYLAFLGLFYSQIKRIFNLSYSLLIVFLLATIPQLADYATIMYADLILAAFVTCGLVYLIQFIRRGNKASLFLSSALFGISLWVKNEAIIFVGAFWAVLLVYLVKMRRSERSRAADDLFPAFIIMIAIGAPWFLAKHTTGAINSDLDFTSMTFGRVIQNIKDIPVLLNLFQQEVFGPKKWNIFWILFFAALIWKRKLLWKSEFFYMSFFILLASVGYFFAYMLMTGENLYFYVNTTISRFMLHFCGIALFIMANLAYKDVKEIPVFGGESSK